MRTILFAFALLAASARAQSTWTQSLVGVSNTSATGAGIHALDFDSGDGAPTTASASKSFTGMDRLGATQTMTFSGTTTNRAEFGRLRSFTTGRLVNSYYNAANPAYESASGGVADPDGSPDSFASLGFAGFDDTLQFGGSLKDGYKARYVFHVDGTNEGQGYLADLAVKVGNDADEAFFAFAPGYNQATWATVDHEIDGTNPTAIHVQFSNQVVFDAFDLADGGTYEGTSDFSSTLTLAYIQVVDENGDPVSGVTVESGSGTVYAVPEPASLAALAGGLLLLRRRRR